MSLGLTGKGSAFKSRMSSDDRIMQAACRAPSPQFAKLLNRMTILRARYGSHIFTKSWQLRES